MYPADDLLIRVRLVTEQARALKASMEIHRARARALQERIRGRRGDGIARDVALATEIGELARTSRRLVEDAREHRRHARLLMEQSRGRRQHIAQERE